MDQFDIFLWLQEFHLLIIINLDYQKMESYKGLQWLYIHYHLCNWVRDLEKLLYN